LKEINFDSTKKKDKIKQTTILITFADIVLFRFEVQTVIKILSLILQLEHTDKDLTIPGAGGGGEIFSLDAPDQNVVFLLSSEKLPVNNNK
jgi:hypothetical protein